jgi:hypothetical protein
MEKAMQFSKLFITGCDSTTKWLLPWFQDNFYRHNPDATLKVYNFDTFHPTGKGWFKKPAAMMDASKLAEKVCWLDTDCEVRGNLNGIWNHLEPNKLGMVEDLPWSRRREERWHNSGVVAFQSWPNILSEWAAACDTNPREGDQEILHALIKEGMRRMIHISDLPREYNTLRLDLIDNTAPKNIKIMHWTGQKGKDKIRSMMNG